MEAKAEAVGNGFATEKIVNAFTVDVEDYFQVTAFEGHIGRNQWDQFESRVEKSTYRLLELLAKHKVRGTFFVLGWTASKHPGLVRDIHAAGHEIGSHSYWHRLVYDLSPEEFRHDLCRSRDVLEELIGQPVTIYRAPSFSIVERSKWALTILAEEGFTVDSSIFPTHHDRYGIPDAECQIHSIETAAGVITECPPTVFRAPAYNLPISGGGYFRLYPFTMTRYCLARTSARTNQPFMFYTHPWEIDPNQPRLDAGSRTARFRHHVNLRRTYAKLEKMLTTFRFASIREVLTYRGTPSTCHPEGAGTETCFGRRPKDLPYQGVSDK
jgi:polysaccharide deacetylase family protein (PEP-CTERM system associated)